MSVTFTGPVPIPSQQTTPLTILITGASRGIGFELTKQYSQAHRNNLVFAAVRDPSSSSNYDLNQYASQHKNVHIIPLDVSNETSIKSSLSYVTALTDHIDVLINNAGVAGGNNPSTVTGEELNRIFNINTFGPLLVTQTYLPLLHTKAGHAPSTVVSLSTGIGSNIHAYTFNTPFIAYGASKAALNYINTVLKNVFPDIVFLVISPGWVDTDMGNQGGMKAPTSVSDTAQATIYYIQNKSLTNSGEFVDVTNGQLISY